MKPNKQRIKLWIKALRSGKYRRNMEALRESGNKRCCLGVACDVFRKSTGKGEWVWRVGGYHFRVGDRSESSFPPIRVMNWFGIDCEDPKIHQSEAGGVTYSASGCNDDLNHSFNKIADSIERTFIKTGK